MRRSQLPSTAELSDFKSLKKKKSSKKRRFCSPKFDLVPTEKHSERARERRPESIVSLLTRSEYKSQLGKFPRKVPACLPFFVPQTFSGNHNFLKQPSMMLVIAHACWLWTHAHARRLIGEREIRVSNLGAPTHPLSIQQPLIEWHKTAPCGQPQHFLLK